VKKILICTLLVCVAVSTLSLSAIAQDEGQDKLQKTTGNVLLGWTEIPKAVVAVTKDSDNPFLGITVGLLKGIANAFARTVSGAASVVTLHKKDQESVIKPSMVDIPDTGTK
jgi:putative exosortase-associated protein (TIGR04073 family)